MKNISCTATDIKWVVIHITQLPRKGDKTGKMGDRCLKIFFLMIMSKTNLRSLPKLVMSSVMQSCV